MQTSTLEGNSLFYQALNGTTALHWECLRQGAVILRAHDTREAVEVVRMFDQFMQA